MKNNPFLIFVLLLYMFGWITVEAAEKPNVVLIMADAMGWLKSHGAVLLYTDTDSVKFAAPKRVNDEFERVFGKAAFKSKSALEAFASAPEEPQVTVPSNLLQVSQPSQTPAASLRTLLRVS